MSNLCTRKIAGSPKRPFGAFDASEESLSWCFSRFLDGAKDVFKQIDTLLGMLTTCYYPTELFMFYFEGLLDFAVRILVDLVSRGRSSDILVFFFVVSSVCVCL